MPVDYNNPSGEKTSIYTYTKKRFDPGMPTLVYIVGGPGGTPRGTEFQLPNSNVLFFDQRGTACSRPETRNQFVNPHFYSSENTAHDILMILDSYQINKAVIYGHSYGTIPGTIFASKYPARVEHLILEGVVFHADATLWDAPRRKTNIERFFYSMSLAEQRKVLAISARSDVPKYWFSFMGRIMLASGGFASKFRTFLDQTLFQSSDNQNETDHSFVEMMNNVVPKIDPNAPDEEFFYGDVTMGMLGCQEMNMADPDLGELIFENGHLVNDKINLERISICSPLGLDQVTGDFYRAEQYPFVTPVTYLLGEEDSLTVIDQGIAHFKNSESLNKQMLIMSEGGHMPNLDQLMEASLADQTPESQKHYRQQLNEQVIFEKIIRNRRITHLDLVDYNNSGDRKWSLYN